MEKTLCISTSCHLQLGDGYLLYTAKGQQEKRDIPIKELGYLILENKHITLSQSLLVALTKNKVAVVTCDEKHLPSD